MIEELVNYLTLERLVFASLLVMILIISFITRARVFCQYLKHMTGINLKPRDVKKIYRLQGKEGVRDLLIDLLVRKDIEDSVIRTPDSPGKESPINLIESD